jgi:hypothetical protein
MKPWRLYLVCLFCDAGVGSVAEARRRGWTRIDKCEWKGTPPYTHVGVCPECGETKQHQPELFAAMAQWQVFVAADSEEGGILVPVEPTEPSGFWIDIQSTEAAQAAISKEWVRLHGKTAE